MKVTNLGGASGLNAYVKNKLERFRNSPRDFSALFQLMFSERENILYERSLGYRLEKITYGEVHDRILHRVAAMQTLGLPREAVVGLYLPNSLEWIEAFWTILLCGCRPLLMNLRLDEATLKAALRDSGAVLVISDGTQFSVNTIRLPEPAPEPAEPVPGSELLLMSSGTSRHVKLCAYGAEEFYQQINDSAALIRKCRQIKKHYRGQLKLLTFLPFYHIFGLSAVYIWFTFFSRTLVQLNDLAPETIVNTIRRHEVTHIFAVPLFWEKVYQQAMNTIRARGLEEKFTRALRLGLPRAAFRQVRENLFGESIRFMITGGSEIRRPVMEFFNGIGYRLADGYGMTELGITSVELSGRKKWLNACSVGKPLPSVEYRIENGELLVRGSSTAKYILEGGVRRERGEWFHTRDLARCRRGRYYILGRQDDVVISANGENLNPNLIEPQFDQPVCLIRAEVPTLLVSVGRSVTQEQLTSIKRQLQQRLSERGLAPLIGKVVYLSQSLMLEQEFKLNRTRLAADYAAGRLTEAVPDETAAAVGDTALLNQLREIFAVALERKPEEIPFEADFFLDLGGTSLDYYAMLSRLEQEFSRPVQGKSLKECYEFLSHVD